MRKRNRKTRQNLVESVQHSARIPARTGPSVSPPAHPVSVAPASAVLTAGVPIPVAEVSAGRVSVAHRERVALAATVRPAIARHTAVLRAIGHPPTAPSVRLLAALARNDLGQIVRVSAPESFPLLIALALIAHFLSPQSAAPFVPGPVARVAAIAPLSQRVHHSGQARKTERRARFAPAPGATDHRARGGLSVLAKRLALPAQMTTAIAAAPVSNRGPVAVPVVLPETGLDRTAWPGIVPRAAVRGLRARMETDPTLLAPGPAVGVTVDRRGALTASRHSRGAIIVHPQKAARHAGRAAAPGIRRIRIGPAGRRGLPETLRNGKEGLRTAGQVLADRELAVQRVLDQAATIGRHPGAEEPASVRGLLPVIAHGQGRLDVRRVAIPGAPAGRAVRVWEAVVHSAAKAALVLQVPAQALRGRVA